MNSNNIVEKKKIKFHVSYTLTSPYWDEPDSDIKTEIIELEEGIGEVNSDVIKKVLSKKIGITSRNKMQVSKIIAFSMIQEI